MEERDGRGEKRERYLANVKAVLRAIGTGIAAGKREAQSCGCPEG